MTDVTREDVEALVATVREALEWYSGAARTYYDLRSDADTALTRIEQLESGLRTTRQIAVDNAYDNLRRAEAAEARVRELESRERELFATGVALANADARVRELEVERDTLQHFIDCADTPLMRDVLAERDEWKRKAEKGEA